MPSYEAIQAQIEKLRVKEEALRVRAEAQRQKELGTVIKRILGEMDQHGITMDDLGGSFKGHAVPIARKASAKTTSSKLNGRKLNLAPKYREPGTGNTWTGHGRAPAWISDAADRDVFLIGKKAAVKSPAKKSAAAEKKTAKKATSKLAGRKLNLAPKYRDPNTGNTWTGHGKAPAWIRDVVNRDAFLIAKTPGPKTQKGNSTAAGKTTKKAAVKKSAPRKMAAKQQPEAAAQE
jgi:DNA-binding protein H-NS